MKREERINYDNTSFFGMLKILKLRSLTIKNSGFWLSILISTLYYYFSTELSEVTLNELAEYLFNTLPGVSATLLGIIIAGLAIIIALSAGDIYNKLLKQNTLQKLLFPFWYVAILWGITTFLSLLLRILFILTDLTLINLTMTIIIFFFTYSLYGTMSLVGSTIRIMVYLAQIKN